MKDKLTSRQMINVELATRARNKHSASILKDHMPEEEQTELKIEFNCECSNPACQERIALTLKEYDRLHKKQSSFIVVKGHSEPSVEKIQKSSPNVTVVDKYAL